MIAVTDSGSGMTRNSGAGLRSLLHDQASGKGTGLGSAWSLALSNNPAAMCGTLANRDTEQLSTCTFRVRQASETRLYRSEANQKPQCRRSSS